MKDYTKEEIATAKRMAFRYIYDTRNILMNRSFVYDRRTRVGNLAAAIVKNTPVDRAAIKAKKRARAANRPLPFRNVLNNPLVRDYIANGGYVLPDRLAFRSGRNHWAKNDFDRKILKVLAGKK